MLQQMADISRVTLACKNIVVPSNYHIPGFKIFIFLSNEKKKKMFCIIVEFPKIEYFYRNAIQNFKK